MLDAHIRQLDTASGSPRAGASPAPTPSGDAPAYSDGDLALQILAKLVIDAYTDFGHLRERPYLSLDCEITLDDDQLALISRLEETA